MHSGRRSPSAETPGAALREWLSLLLVEMRRPQEAP
jgi:hypothetical protein